MPSLEIDGKSYDIDALPDQVKNTLFHVQAIDAEINRMNTLIAVMQTAKTAYVNSIKEALQSQPSN